MTAGLSSFTTPSSYWQASRAPRYSLLFALPLLLFYQTLAVLLSHGARSVRIGGGRWLVTRDMRAHGSRLRGRVFAAMLGESVLLASLFGLAVGSVTSGVLGLLQTLALPPTRDLDWWTRLMVSLGAGIYEEL